VPTMGYLHEGHLSLARRARQECAFVVMSIFVNPTQFGPHEDFDRYPRDLPRDIRLAEQAGVDLIFAPPVEEMYPPSFSTYVEVEGVTARWEGERRPGHFRGVATVVLKLFNQVQPDRAYFGEKDYQQLQVVKKMVRDLDLPIEVIGCPIVREYDGLAMSSRNVYLSPEQRGAATVLYRALRRGQELAAQGEREVARLLKGMRAVLNREPLVQEDYLAIVDPTSLEPLERVAGPARILIAGRIGGVRLIDNMLVE
ncbi:MAG: pantoate--beta-alanine ligase, partial [Chloroflexota bacterium]